MAVFRRKVCKEGHLLDPSWKICPVCTAPICGWLVVMNGQFKNKVYTIHEGKNKIGSGVDCEVRILIPDVLRHHATLTSEHVASGAKEALHFKLINQAAGDTESVQVNNVPIQTEPIIDGDIIKLGGLELKFKCL
jgi:hypothetical protein